MKSQRRCLKPTAPWYRAAVFFACVISAPLFAADPETNAPVPAASPTPLTPEKIFEGGTNSYNNWVDVSAGGFITGGNSRQFQQQHQTSKGAFGGIEDFHF